MPTVHREGTTERGLTRRRLLQLGGAFTGAVLLPWGVPSTVRAAADPILPYERMGLLTDLTLCVGCRACEAACNRANNLPPPEVPFSNATVFRKMRRPTPGAFTVVNRYFDPRGGPPIYRKVQCMHCNEPTCVSVCPVAALVKTPEGPVLWDEKVCIGCRYCMIACPFYSLSYEYSSPYHPRVRKCVMCYERTFRRGGTPACAEACPTGATIFGRRGELIRIARRRIAEQPGKYVDHIYGEREVGGTSWLYLSPVPFDQVGFPKVEESPYGEFTWDFLTAVPVVLVLWPLFMVGLHRFGRRREQMAVEDALQKAKTSRKEGRDES